MAWVTICASSMAAKAGLSHPLLDRTSTHAWISRIACRQGAGLGWKAALRDTAAAPRPSAAPLHLAEDLLRVRLQLGAQLHAR